VAAFSFLQKAWAVAAEFSFEVFGYSVGSVVADDVVGVAGYSLFVLIYFLVASIAQCGWYLSVYLCILHSLISQFCLSCEAPMEAKKKC
jgi:hypothetical protein